MRSGPSGHVLMTFRVVRLGAEALFPTTTCINYYIFMNDEDDEQLLDSDEDIDWEEVPIEAAQQDLEITLSSAPVEQIKSVFSLFIPFDFSYSARRGRTISHAERLLRIGCHKLHTLCLLSNARVRNQWLNDELLHVCCPAYPYSLRADSQAGAPHVADTNGPPNQLHCHSQIALS